jgi:hypothetical protein
VCRRVGFRLHLPRARWPLTRARMYSEASTESGMESPKKGRLPLEFGLSSFIRTAPQLRQEKVIRLMLTKWTK